MKRSQIEKDGNELSEAAGVPIRGGYVPDDRSYVRYDFNEPLSDDEIDAVEKAAKGRVFSVFQAFQFFLRPK